MGREREAWIADAANITKNSSNPQGTLHTNSKVKEFLEDDRKRFICATKGFGKTYLLKLKSISIRESKTGAVFIPKNELVDRIGSMQTPSLSMEVYSKFNDTDEHELLWRYSFIITIIRNSENLFNKIVNSKSINYPKELFPSKIDYPVVQDIYIMLLDNYSLFRDIRSHDYIKQFEITLRNSLEPFYIFIDNVDEFYDTTGYIYDEDIWYSAQIALLRAVWKFTSQHSHIHIYATIRKKALDKLKDDDILYAQYRDFIVELKYTRKDLEQIFINNIKLEKKDRLKIPYLIHYANTTQDYMEAFIGFKDITNRFLIQNQEEELFSYVYRHTLGRPRDLMRMGRAISQIDPPQRDENTIRIAINQMAKENGEQYIKEISKFIYIDFEKTYRLIEKNILYPEDTKRVCCAYNNKKDGICSQCEDEHIFCTLHDYGLLGIEYVNTLNNECLIKFRSAGYQPSYGKRHTLPKSARYFIHPSLSEIIEAYREDKHLNPYTYDRNIIVGYDLQIDCSINIPNTIKVPGMSIEVADKLVTFSEYDFYCDNNGIEPPFDEGWGRGERPVINISWEDAVSYAEWLSERTNEKYRLPTEEEWNHICGSVDKKWFFGDDENQLRYYAWYIKNSEGRTHPVATKEPNMYGIYDLYGNVWEWCSSDGSNDSSDNKVVKGGAFDSYADDTYTSVRGVANRNRGYNNVGFRLVKEPKGFSLH